MFSIMNSKGFLQNYKIKFLKNLNKREKKLLEISNLKKEKNIFTQEEILEKLKLKDFQEIEKFLLDFSKKVIIIEEKKNNLKVQLSILKSYIFLENKIYIFYGEEIRNSFLENNIFNKIGLDKLLIFKEKYAYEFYEFLLREKNKKNEIEISIEKIREILDAKNLYTRFFDLEKKLLIPIVKELKTMGELKFSYEKIKCGNHRGGKILGIKLNFLEFFQENKKNINFKIEREFKSLYEVHGVVSNIINKYNEKYLYNHLLQLKFLLKIYTLKDGEKMVLNDKKYIIEINYKKNKPSKIEVFLKEK
ncbi:replication initiation protein [Cetobacterium ceti]|nr:replication initiation protein [Cetobacterium ceti]